MKKAIKLTAILCALVLLMGLAGCDDKAAQTPKYETITVEMPEQQAEVAGEKIIKADRAIYSLWMLTTNTTCTAVAIPKMDSRI